MTYSVTFWDYKGGISVSIGFREAAYKLGEDPGHIETLLREWTKAGFQMPFKMHVSGLEWLTIERLDKGLTQYYIRRLRPWGKGWRWFGPTGGRCPVFSLELVVG